MAWYRPTVRYLVRASRSCTLAITALALGCMFASSMVLSLLLYRRLRGPPPPTLRRAFTINALAAYNTAITTALPPTLLSIKYARAARRGPWRTPRLQGLQALLAHHRGERGIVAMCRFGLDDIHTLAGTLLPAQVRPPGKYGQFTAVDALSLLLYRYSWPRRLVDMAEDVGYHEATLSALLRHTAILIQARFGDRLENPRWLSIQRLQQYADAIAAAGCPDPTIVGFLDGTRRGIARPRLSQRLYYNGWLHCHGLIFIAVAFPDGTFLLRGPLPGRHNDLSVLQHTGLFHDLPELLHNQFTVGGDGIFPVTEFLHSNRILLDGLVDVADRTAYSSVRVSVEWLFSFLTSKFLYFRLESVRQVAGTIPAIHYKVAALLGLCYASLNGSPIADHFGLHAPWLRTILG